MAQSTTTRKKWTVDLPVVVEWRVRFPLHAAAQGGDINVVRSLVKANPAGKTWCKVNIN